MEATSGSNFRMIDVSPKAVTHRRSLAEGRIYLSPLVFEKVRSRTLPKGDALVLAEVAGIMAAKNTALLLPLCHPLPIEAVLVTCELEPEEQAVRRCGNGSPRGCAGGSALHLRSQQRNRSRDSDRRCHSSGKRRWQIRLLAASPSRQTRDEGTAKNAGTAFE
jgi:hypothetical protein